MKILTAKSNRDYFYIAVIAFLEMLAFVAILLVGYIWAWKKGALEWD